MTYTEYCKTKCELCRDGVFLYRGSHRIPRPPEECTEWIDSDWIPCNAKRDQFAGTFLICAGIKIQCVRCLLRLPLYIAPWSRNQMADKSYDIVKVYFKFKIAKTTVQLRKLRMLSIPSGITYVFTVSTDVVGEQKNG